MQQGIVSWNKQSLELENGSKIIAASTSASAVRGGSYNIIFLDEFAFIPNHIADAFFASVYPTISSGKNTKVIIVSTPHGMNHFYRMWHDAERQKNEYVPTAVHWSEVPGRNAKWKQQTIANTSEQQFKVEFECEFLGSVDTLIDVTKLRNLVYEDPIKRNKGLDIQGNIKIQIVFDWKLALQQFDYQVIRSFPSIQNTNLGMLDLNKNETILHEITYRSKIDQDVNKLFSVEVGVSSNCLPRHNILVSAMYSINLEECFHLNEIFLNEHPKERTSTGWRTKGTLVFFPDVYHYSCLHVKSKVDTQRLKMNSTLKLLTDPNNKCSLNGGCLAIANIYLNRTFTDDILVPSNEEFYELMTNVTVSYAVSMYILQEENTTFSTSIPVDFNVHRRLPVHVNNSLNLRYDICEATECLDNGRCVSNRFRNIALAHDASIHIDQTHVSLPHYVSATCSFEPFAYLDGSESPFIYVRSWFKYEIGVSDKPYWWCNPDLRARLTKAPLISRHTRRLTFL